MSAPGEIAGRSSRRWHPASCAAEREVAAAAGQQEQALLKAIQQRSGGHDVDPGRGELDGQGSPSRRRQMAAMAAALSVVRAKSG